MAKVRKIMQATNEKHLSFVTYMPPAGQIRTELIYCAYGKGTKRIFRQIYRTY